MSTNKHITIKIWVKTRRLLRLIAAHSGESMLAVIHRLAKVEWLAIQAMKSDDKDE